MDFLAAPATDSLGLQKIDYIRYGGPFRAYDSQVHPLIHLPEAQVRVQRIYRAHGDNKPQRL